MLALSIDLYFYTGYYGSDDKSYVMFAREIANGNVPLKAGDLGEFISESGQNIDFGALRFGYTLPLSLIYFISGGSLFCLTFLNILLHIAIIVVTFKIGELLDGSKVGIFASFITAVSPVFYLYSGMILPDNSEVFWLFLSIFMVLQVQKRLAHNEIESSGTVIKKLFLAGLFIGLSYSAKLSALIMLVPVGIFLLTLPQKLFSKTTLHYVLSFTAGFALIFILETIIIYFLFDDLIVRYQIIAGMKDHYLRRASQQGSSILERYRRMQYIFGLHFEKYILILTFFSIAWFPFIIRKNNLLWFILVWGILYKTYGTTNFTDYAPPVVQVRYFAFTAPIIGIILGQIFKKIYIIVSDYVKYKTELEMAVIILIAGIFTAFAYTNISANLRFAGRLYRAPLIQSTDNALRFLNNNHPGSTVVLSDTCKYWFYPYYFLDDSNYLNPSLKQKADSYPYYIIASMATEFNQHWFNKLIPDSSPNIKIDFIDVCHPDPTPYTRYCLSDEVPAPYPNETIFNRYRAFIVKVDTAEFGKQLNSRDITDIGNNFLLLYHQTAYPDVRVFKNTKSHLIEWVGVPEGREIFINSFDTGLKSTPPEHKLLGAVDRSAESYSFEYKLTNEGNNQIEVKSEIYLYSNVFRINTVGIRTTLNPGGSKIVKLDLHNKDQNGRNFRIQLFILNKSGEDGKLSVKDFNVIQKYNSGNASVSR